MEAAGLEPVTKNRIGTGNIGSAGYLDKNLDKKSVQFAGYDFTKSIVYFVIGFFSFLFH